MPTRLQMPVTSWGGSQLDLVLTGWRDPDHIRLASRLFPGRLIAGTIDCNVAPGADPVITVNHHAKQEAPALIGLNRVLRPVASQYDAGIVQRQGGLGVSNRSCELALVRREDNRDLVKTGCQYEFRRRGKFSAHFDPFNVEFPGVCVNTIS